MHRIKCGEKKPCTQCVASKAECIVAYALPSAPHPKKNGHSPTIHEPLCVLPCCPYLETLKTYSFSRADSISNTYNGHDKETIPTPTVIPTTDDLSLPTDYTCRNQGVWASAATVTNIPITRSSILDKDFTTNTKAASTQYYAMTSHLLPQHPHDVFPLGHHDHITNVLSKEVRGYYLRVFRDDCHPFMPILNARDFEKLADGSLATVLDTNSSIRAIADMVIALSMQHVHATGLAGRVLGVYQSTLGQQAPSGGTTWPGFEYFDRCRNSMRIAMNCSLQNLQCHTFMITYLLKGNAYQEAYNLIGITVRKAYIARLHQAPSNSLNETDRTAHMQSWWTLYTLDIQCSSQLDMPTAIQKSVVRCPAPTEEALIHYLSFPNDQDRHISSALYSMHLKDLAVIMADFRSHISSMDFTGRDDNDSNDVSDHALDLGSTFHRLRLWHERIPAGLRLCRRGDGRVDEEPLEIERDLVLPVWLQRHKLFLELLYRNACILFQRSCATARSPKSTDVNIAMDDLEAPVELHIKGALHHATMIVDLVHTVGSMSDILYGWHEVLQTLWNATTTLIAYISSDLSRADMPQVLDVVTRARACFEIFPSEYSIALVAKRTIQSMIDDLQVAIASQLFGPDLTSLEEPDNLALLPEEQQLPWSDSADFSFLGGLSENGQTSELSSSRI